MVHHDAVVYSVLLLTPKYLYSEGFYSQTMLELLGGNGVIVIQLVEAL
jgi:hypothetical protein